MMQLRGFLLVAAALLLAGQAGAASFTVTDYTLGRQVSYELRGEADRSWTAQLQATLDGAMGTSLCADLEPGQKDGLREEILGRARTVAEAAGGFLGLGNKISREEEVVLQQLAKPFER